ncbi:invasin domain 3-containing protein, partial [Yersinia pseudotuberculosis]
AAPVNIEANGSDTSVVTLTLRDNNNNPVTGQTVAFTSTLGTLGNVTEQASGLYTATLTAGTVSGVASLSVSVGGNALGVTPATVTLNGDSGNLSTTNSTLVAAPVNIEANGSDTSVVTLTLRDNNNNPVTGQTVAFTSTLGTLGNVTEQASGLYTATLTAGTLTGTASLSVNVDGNNLGTTPATINVIPAPVDLTVLTDNARKNIGQAISLTVIAKYKSTDVVAPNVKMTFEQVAVVNRQNSPVSSSGVVQIDDANYDAFTGMTDANGQLTVSVTDPNGIGVQTTLRAKAESGDMENTNVTFNVITSPDSAQASMWGNMAETLTASGVTFKRPYLAAEKPGTIGTNVENNETWAMFNQSQAVAMCTVPSSSQLVSLYNLYPLNQIQTVAGWPTMQVYRSSTSAVIGQHFYVYMNTGNYAYNSIGNGDVDGNYNVSCSL